MKNMEDELAARRAQRTGIVERAAKNQRALITAAFALIGCSLAVTATVVGVRALNDSDENQFSWDMYRQVESLRINGACADELEAQRDYSAKFASIARNDTIRDQQSAFADLYGTAAALAAAHDIPCFPADAAAFQTELTPGFSVGALVDDNLCAEEILATNVDPDEALNDLLKQNAILGNYANELNAELARTYQASCE